MALDTIQASTPMPKHTKLTRWASRWNDELLRFVNSRVVSRADAQDLAQEVYLRMLRLKDADAVRDPEAYLIRVASHVITEWRLRARQAKPHTSEELECQVDSGTPELDLEYSMSQQRFDAALAALAPMVRATLILRVRDGMRHAEIAAHLRITPRQVRRNLAHSYDELRRSLDPSDLRILSRA
jgi:RNA polymerase sigma-70 factor (ECF subfamily)